MDEELNKILSDDNLLKEIAKRNISRDEIYRQITMFVNGVPNVKLISACTIGDGITKIDEKDETKYLELFEKYKLDGLFAKFVPASGAASRMFKAASSILINPDCNTIDDLKHCGEDGSEVKEIIENLNRFAFYDDLRKACEKNGDKLADLLSECNVNKILGYILKPEGLGYADMPKGMIKFHDYGRYSRTAFEEHLAEAIDFTADSNNSIIIHFTVQPSFEDMIANHLRLAADDYSEYNFDISLSNQKQSTDTIGVTPDNKPFINDDGSILFRPGGHGALIENLNDFDADIVFIKNVDNVMPAWHKQDTVKYKKLLGGYFMAIREKIFDYLIKIDDNTIREDEINDALKFIEEELCITPPVGENDSFEVKKKAVFKQLDRPLRVCGMVKNQGEPGGGPFFIDQNGIKSLQIIEKAQIDINDSLQEKIMNESTHFNPVDLVCGLKDHRGRKYDLTKFTDNSLSFIAEKSKDGRPLKALEHPGLWNGAMARWNTIFVEAPISTFSPIKTVNDLLRKEHQPE